LRQSPYKIYEIAIHKILRWVKNYSHSIGTCVALFQQPS